MKITNVQRSHCQIINDELTQAISKVAAKYGLELAPLRISYIPGTAGLFATKVELKTDGAKVEDVSEQNRSLGLYQLKIGQTWNEGQFTFEIVGYNRKASKSPVKIKRNDGKGFKASANHCQRALGLPTTTNRFF
jgi:hypothetical protein